MIIQYILFIYIPVMSKNKADIASPHDVIPRSTMPAVSDSVTFSVCRCARTIQGYPLYWFYYIQLCNFSTF